MKKNALQFKRLSTLLSTDPRYLNALLRKDTIEVANLRKSGMPRHMVSTIQSILEREKKL